MLGVYCLAVLAFTPCGDDFSLDHWLRRTKKQLPPWAYAYPILLMQLLMAWTYFSSALYQDRVAGLKYLSEDNLPALAIFHSLDNLHDTHFKLAFWLPQLRSYLPYAVGSGSRVGVAVSIGCFLAPHAGGSSERASFFTSRRCS